jgi:hypothetical protein
MTVAVDVVFKRIVVFTVATAVWVVVCKTVELRYLVVSSVLVTRAVWVVVWNIDLVVFTVEVAV